MIPTLPLTRRSATARRPLTATFAATCASTFAATLAATLAAAFVPSTTLLPLGVSAARAQSPTAPTAPTGPTARPWNPSELDANVGRDSARAMLRRSDVRRAEVGYLFALPPFLHFRQRWGWMQGVRQTLGPDVNPYGRWLLLREPASPRTTDPQPNHDTLYGAAYLDLGAGPMVLRVPDVPGRYFSVAIHDAYFYAFAYVGSRTTGQRAGDYLLVGPQWRGATPPGIAQVIRAPTNSVNLYQRIWFRDARDLPAVRALQDRIALVPLARWLDPTAAVTLPDPGPVLAASPLAATDPVAMLALANRYTGENPPPPEDRALWEHAAIVGIGPGLAIPADADARAVLTEGAALAQQTITALALEGYPMRDGWQIPPADVGRRGGPGSVALQATTQVRAIGSNVPDEAVYYMAYTDGTGAALSSDRRYVLRFAADRIPPVAKERHGFWSLTMYDRARYLLVDNVDGRYAVRPSDPLVYGADGSLTLYIQRDPPRERARRANWLPAPPSGDFVLNLRVYLGGPDVVAGRYAPPALVAVP